MVLIGMVERSAWSQVVSWPGEQDGDKLEASRRSHVGWKHFSFFDLLFSLQQRIRHCRPQRPPNVFPCPQKTKAVNSGGRNEPKLSFSRCASCLESTQLSVCSTCLCVRCGFDPLGGLTAPPRDRFSQLHPHLAATSHTSFPCFHLPHNFFLPPSFFFLHPLITNTCSLAVPPTAAKPPDCFSL